MSERDTNEITLENFEKHLENCILENPEYADELTKVSESVMNEDRFLQPSGVRDFNEFVMQNSINKPELGWMRYGLLSFLTVSWNKPGKTGVMLAFPGGNTVFYSAINGELQVREKCELDKLNIGWEKHGISGIVYADK